MADYEARIAPFINIEFVVTSEWWEEPRNHRGLDISTGGTGSDLYSMCDGVVVRSDFSESFGNVIIIKASDGMGFLYAHMREKSPLNVGDTVKIGDHVGHEGNTGESFGIHLHIEMQDLSTHEWIYQADKSYYSNPADFMGIPNVQGISAIYYGTPKPPEPPKPTKNKNSIKWLLTKSKKINIFY